jgi:hypothetical protein
LSRPTADQGNAITDSREFLAFKLGDEKYGMATTSWTPRHGHRFAGKPYAGPARHRKLMTSAEMGFVAQTLQ